MEAMGIIFSNIYDSKMGDLTWERTSGSIPFGGRYRQIDFVLSNMSNSGIRNIGIITQKMQSKGLAVRCKSFNFYLRL